jgi:hypothetical protein
MKTTHLIAFLAFCISQTFSTYGNPSGERHLNGKRLSEIPVERIESANITFVSQSFKYLMGIPYARLSTFKDVERKYGIDESGKKGFDQEVKWLESLIEKEAPLRERIEEFKDDAFKAGREVKLLIFMDSEWTEEYLVIIEGDTIINSFQWSSSREIKEE